MNIRSLALCIVTLCSTLCLADDVPVVIKAGSVEITSSATKPLVMPKHPSDPLEITGVTRITLDDAVRASSGRCGGNQCFAWIGQTTSIIVEQPRGFPSPAASFYNGVVEIDFAQRLIDAPQRGMSDPSHDSLQLQAVELRCRSCSSRPNATVDLDAWNCVSCSPCGTCYKCISGPC